MVGPAGMGLFWLWPLLVIVGLLLLGYAVVAGARTGSRRGASDRGEGRDEARRILGERFARGEIDEEEYRRRWSVLQ